MNRIPTSQPRNRKSATRERARLHHGPTEGKCSRLLLIRLVFIAFSPIMIDIIAHLHPSCTPALTTRVFPQQTCRCDRTPLQSEYPPSGIPTPAAPPQYRSPPDPGGAEPVYRRRSARCPRIDQDPDPQAPLPSPELTAHQPRWPIFLVLQRPQVGSGDPLRPHYSHCERSPPPHSPVLDDTYRCTHATNRLPDGLRRIHPPVTHPHRAAALP